MQLLKNKITNFDAILYTHPHADHLLGFDDVRSINRITGKVMPCYGNEYTINEIKRVFPYIFDAIQKGGGLPKVSFNIINKTIVVDGVKIVPLPVKHGKLDILGYRIGSLAYITDCSYIPDDTYNLLNGIDILILGALRHREHKTHMNIDQAVAVVKKLGVARAFFTHMSHDIEYEEVSEQLPDHIQLAYDGLKLKF